MNFSIGKTTFVGGEDFTTGASCFGIEDKWTLIGVEKLIALKLWSRVRGADHRFETPCPTVEDIRSLAASLAVEPLKKVEATAAPKVAAMPAAPAVRAMSPAAALAVLAAAETKAAPVKPAPPAASAYSPEQVAARINGEKPAAEHGWDDVIEKVNATAKRRR